MDVLNTSKAYHNLKRFFVGWYETFYGIRNRFLSSIFPNTGGNFDAPCTLPNRFDPRTLQCQKCVLRFEKKNEIWYIF